MNKEEFQGFRERFNRFENGFNELVKDQNKKNIKWDQLTKQYTRMKLEEKQEIKLDIGGTKYTTTRETLGSRESKYFADLLANTSNNEIYIDRPGTNFDYILSYLRGGKFNCSIVDNPQLKFALTEEARFYGLWELLDDLLCSEKDLTSPSHIHKLTRVDIQKDFVCRGHSLFTDSSTCYNFTGDKTNFMYECKTCKTGNIKYCVACSHRDDKTFTNPNHAHELTIHTPSGTWQCDGRNLKDGCKSNNKTTGILRFRCAQCEYNMCEYCLTHYR